MLGVELECPADLTMHTPTPENTSSCTLQYRTILGGEDEVNTFLSAYCIPTKQLMMYLLNKMR